MTKKFTGHLVLTENNECLTICNDIIIYSPNKYRSYNGSTIQYFIKNFPNINYKLLKGGRYEQNI